MKRTDISSVRRFIGCVEGVMMSICSDDVRMLLGGYIEVVDEILDREEKVLEAEGRLE